ncbi:MAG: CoA pyrophosphatase [Clostridiales bacterium]|nr:CoA pyrophosphatase [Clostridiales bacterium]
MNGFDLKIGDIEKIFSGRVPGVIGGGHDYSVLVPLVKKDGELNLLFEVRSSNLERQPGEVCFPGGRVEDGETAEECAVRETAEELGLDGRDIKVIAQLDTIYTYSNFTLYSFLGEIDYDTLSRAEINHKEVESIFYVPLSKFMLNDPYIHVMELIPNANDFPYEMVNFPNGYNWRKGISAVPIYQFHEEIIWGLTARISHNLAEILREKP